MILSIWLDEERTNLKTRKRIMHWESSIISIEGKPMHYLKEIGLTKRGAKGFKNMNNFMSMFVEIFNFQSHYYI